MENANVNRAFYLLRKATILLSERIKKSPNGEESNQLIQNARNLNCESNVNTYNLGITLETNPTQTGKLLHIHFIMSSFILNTTHPKNEGDGNRRATARER